MESLCTRKPRCCPVCLRSVCLFVCLSFPSLSLLPVYVQIHLYVSACAIDLSRRGRPLSPPLCRRVSAAREHGLSGEDRGRRGQPLPQSLSLRHLHVQDFRPVVLCRTVMRIDICTCVYVHVCICRYVYRGRERNEDAAVSRLQGVFTSSFIPSVF